MTTTSWWWRLPTWQWTYIVPAHLQRALVRLTVTRDTLAPYLLPGDMLVIDPGRSAVPGDLVLALVSLDAPGIRWTLGNAAFSPGKSVELLQLRRDSQGGARLCTRFGSSYAHHHRIVGVAVLIHRRPSWRWRCLRAPITELRAKVAL